MKKREGIKGKGSGLGAMTRYIPGTRVVGFTCLSSSSLPSFSKSLVSPSLGAHILLYNDFCYLLPFSRCAQPRTHLCWDRNLIPGSALLFHPAYKGARKYFSLPSEFYLSLSRVTQVSLDSSPSPPPPPPLICLEFAEDNINVSSYEKKMHSDVTSFLLCR